MIAVYVVAPVVALIGGLLLGEYLSRRADKWGRW